MNEKDTTETPDVSQDFIDGFNSCQDRIRVISNWLDEENCRLDAGTAKWSALYVALHVIVGAMNTDMSYPIGEEFDLSLMKDGGWDPFEDGYWEKFNTDNN